MHYFELLIFARKDLYYCNLCILIPYFFYFLELVISDDLKHK